MKEAIVTPEITVSIQDAPIPQPGPHDILVKVAVAGINIKDVNFPQILSKAHNAGDDLAGVVEAVGSDVQGFRKGDRVAGMHKFPEPHGAFAEYAVLSDFLAFHIPEHISFEEAATVPLNALTAAFALFWVLGLPSPWQRSPHEKIPLVIYGASTSVAGFAIKLAAAAGIHPIIAVGSPNSAYIKPFLSAAKGDVLLDYNMPGGTPVLVKAIQDAVTAAGVADNRPRHAVDTVSQPGTFDAILSKAMAGAAQAKIATVLAVNNISLPAFDTMLGKDTAAGNAEQQQPVTDDGTALEMAYCGLAHQAGPDAARFATATMAMVGRGLDEGWMTGHPHEVVPGGLKGLQGGLSDLQDGKVRAKKLVVRIGET